VGLHWLEGLLQLQKGDEDGARLALGREIVSGDPSHLYADECCANVEYAFGALAWRAGETASAIDRFDRALQRAPGHLLCRAARESISADSTGALGGRLAVQIARMREHGRGIDAAVADAIPHVLRGDDTAAAAGIERACAGAAPGPQGWSLPLDPLFAVQRHSEAWAGVMAALRTRAA
jgi:hypothetical protein